MTTPDVSQYPQDPPQAWMQAQADVAGLPGAEEEPTYQGKSGSLTPAVPADYYVRSGTPPRAGATYMSGLPQYVRRAFDPATTATPQYSYGQEYSTFAYLAPEYVAPIQQKLIDARLVSDPDAVASGVWSPLYAAAMREVMNWADWTGQSWNTVLDAWSINPIIPDEQTAKYVPGVYAAPDYDSILLDVKDTFRSRLGRDPQPAELHDLAQSLSASYREQYEAYEQARRVEFDRGQADDTGPAPTVEQVDPAASFRRIFEERYKPELNMLQRQADVATNRGLLEGSFATSERLIG